MTNETTHTPGPWAVDAADAEEDGFKHQCFVVIREVSTDPDGAIAFTPDGDERARADADLIAAAPDLLLAAQFLVDFYDVGGNGEGWTLAEVAEKARAAIAKATGQS